MELFKDTHLVKLELLSNATTIDSALNYIRSKQEQQLQHHHHHQQQYPSHAYTDMLLEETEKLYNKLAKELGDEIISDYASGISSPSLPLSLSSSDEQMKIYLKKG